VVVASGKEMVKLDRSKPNNKKDTEAPAPTATNASPTLKAPSFGGWIGSGPLGQDRLSWDRSGLAPRKFAGRFGYQRFGAGRWVASETASGLRLTRPAGSAGWAGALAAVVCAWAGRD
jgi:hypothetical protein